MASSKDYLQFVLEQLSELQEITYRAMMGEFIIYYRGKIVGGIYDDRLLVKPTKSAISYMPTVTYEIPYENAKEMLLVEEVDNKDFLTGLFDVMYDELPTPHKESQLHRPHGHGSHNEAVSSSYVLLLRGSILPPSPWQGHLHGGTQIQKAVQGLES